MLYFLINAYQLKRLCLLKATPSTATSRLWRACPALVDINLILHFKTQDTGIQAGDTSATLYGDLTDGTQIMDEDTVRTIPPHEEKNAASRKGKGKSVFAFRVYLAELAAPCFYTGFH